MWKILEEDLFNPGILSKITSGIERMTEPQGASMLICGGIIRPLIDGDMATVEAIGIHKGKVVATGSKESVTAFMNSNGIQFTVKQLEDKQTLLPGLIEPHVHIVPTALLKGWLDLGRFDGQVLRPDYNPQWLKGQVTRHVKEHKLKYDLGSWILGREVDPALMPFQVNPGGLNELVTFDCTTLDAIEAGIPLLLLSASMHTMYANTKALEKIYSSSKELQQQYANFDAYKAATNGQLQEEEGMAPAMKAIPKLQIVEMALGSFEHLTQIFEEANSRGVTFMYDAGMTSQLKTLLDAYLLFHQKKVRIGAAQICATQQDADNLPAYQPVTEYQDVYYGNIKLVSDGSNQGLTGYQSEAYCCAPADNFGLFNFAEAGDPHPTTPPPGYNALVNTISVQKGWPLMIHANGDLAVQFAIDVYASTIMPGADTTKRNRIEHCSILSAAQIAEMKRLGVPPSFLIGHVGYWGYAFKEAIFEEKSELLDPCKSALDAGLRISLHSDYQVSPLGPLRMMEQSITRVMEAAPGNPNDNVLTPAERITPEQALRAVTHDAAWQCHADEWAGSLKTGHFADFVILEHDPLSLNEYYMVLRNIPVLETWKGGVAVYTHHAITANAENKMVTA